jgi:hypothetical protein
MPEPANFMFRHGWIAFVAVTIINAFIAKFRSRRYIREQPELASGYQKLFRGTLIWENLPWLLMGFSIETGHVRSILSYFRPRDGNPFVSAWFSLVFAEWILGFWWVFFRSGAEFLAKHLGFMPYQVKSSIAVKLLYCLMILGGVIGFTLMWTLDIPELSQWTR